MSIDSSQGQRGTGGSEVDDRRPPRSYTLGDLPQSPPRNYTFNDISRSYTVNGLPIQHTPGDNASPPGPPSEPKPSVYNESRIETAQVPPGIPEESTMTIAQNYAGDTDMEAQTKDESSKHWKIWCLLAIVITLAISLPVGWALRVQDLVVPTPANSAMLQLYGNLVSVDPIAQIMTLDWEIQANCGGDTNITCVDGDIFFDRSLLQTSPGNTAAPSNNGLPTSVFHIEGASLNNATLGFYANSLFFRTQVVTYSREVGFKERTLQAYPFDTYGAEIFIFANNYSIDVAQVNGIAPGFSIRIDPNATFNDPTIQGVDLTLNISRGAVVRVYTISILIAIWLVTLTLLASTVSIVILGRKMAKEVLAVPVGTLFAFTSLRGTLPGAPAGFGAIIDFMAVLPCLAILTFCAVFMLGVFVVDRDPDLTRPPLWNGPVARAKEALKAKSS